MWTDIILDENNIVIVLNLNLVSYYFRSTDSSVTVHQIRQISVQKLSYLKMGQSLKNVNFVL